jgi:hypothetical protein
MALDVRDFTIEQGASFILEFELKRDDNTPLGLTTPTANGVNTYDLGTYSFRMKLRRTKYGCLTCLHATAYSLSSNSVIQVGDDDTEGRTADGFYVIAGTPGKVRLTVNPSSTGAIKHGKYFYDIEAVSGTTGSYEVTKVLSGRMVVNAEATT